MRRPLKGEKVRNGVGQLRVNVRDELGFGERVVGVRGRVRFLLGRQFWEFVFGEVRGLELGFVAAPEAHVVAEARVEQQRNEVEFGLTRATDALLTLFARKVLHQILERRVNATKKESDR